MEENSILSGFRGCEQAGEGIKHQIVTPLTDFLLFGLGRYAWYVMTFVFICCVLFNHARSPGRFFAVQADVCAHSGGVRCEAAGWGAAGGRMDCDHCECKQDGRRYVSQAALVAFFSSFIGMGL
jgi:hypothetical protein